MAETPEEFAQRVRLICRELLARSAEPDIAQQVIDALGPYFPKTEPPEGIKHGRNQGTRCR